MANLKSKYNELIEYMNIEGSRFINAALKLGFPILTTTLPTCAVLYSKDNRKGFEFLMNPDFFENNDLETLHFAMAHEFMHLILSHLNPSYLERYSNQKKLNIAFDCIINDSLHNSYFEVPEWAAHGEKIVGLDCSTLSVDEVYNLIPEDMSEEDSCDHGDLFVDKDGNVFDSDGNLIGTAIPGSASGDEKEFQKVFGDISSDYQDTVMGYVSDNDDSSGLKAGTGFDKKLDHIRKTGIQLEWKKLLKRIDPDIVKGGGNATLKASFRRPRRNLSSQYPKTFIPTRIATDKTGIESGSKPVIILGLDCSGSISQQTKEKFLNLAISIPQDKVEVYCCTFSTDYVEFDLDLGLKQHTAYGGTDFSAVQSFVKSQMNDSSFKNYPKAIIVFTDGEAGFFGESPTKKQKEDSWYWVLDHRGSERTLNAYGHYPDKDHLNYLDDFIKS